jgi:hypothetical protein
MTINCARKAISNLCWILLQGSVALGLAACGGADADSSDPLDPGTSAKEAASSAGRAGGSDEGLIDDACSSAASCVADNAACVDDGDGVARCEARCLGDESCGDRARCLFRTDDDSDVGYCWRTCTSPSDCVDEGWRCEPLASDDDQRFCIPPCLLSDCSMGGFNYTCSTGSYSSHWQWEGDGQTLLVEFANGHSVYCEQPSGGQGTCSDDTGAACTF